MTTPTSSPAAPAVEQAEAARLFSFSLLVSGLRCVLTYIVLPWGLPLLGIAGGVGPAIGILVGVVAIVFNVLSIRRFRASTHPWRYPVMALNAVVAVLLVVLVALDVSELVS